MRHWPAHQICLLVHPELADPARVNTWIVQPGHNTRHLLGNLMHVNTTGCLHGCGTNMCSKYCMLACHVIQYSNIATQGKGGCRLGCPAASPSSCVLNSLQD